MDQKEFLKIADRTSKLAKIFADEIKKGGYKILSDYFFDTITINTEKTDSIYKTALKENINLRKVDSKNISVAFDEAKKLNDVNVLLKIFGSIKSS